MFGNILIGVDGRAGGRDAIALARRLAAPSASFTLAHVDAGPVSWWDHQIAEERVFDRSASMLAAERERAALPAGIVCVGGTAPAPGLHDLAAERAADLIVVGSSRHALLGRVLLGDDARASLDGAPCAIAIPPHGYEETSPPLNEIGVGYDGSPESEHALATARELANAAGAEIKALWVVSRQDVREAEPIPADWPLVALGLVGDRADRLGELDGIVGEAVYGAPPEELSRFSSELDLLIVGAHAHGSPGRVVDRGVSRYLVGHAACPLLVLAPIAVGAGLVVRAA